MIGRFFQNNPKLVSALVGAAIMAGAYYGLPPEVSQPIIEGFIQAISK